MLVMEKSIIKTECYPVFCTSKASLNLPSTFLQGSANLIFEVLSKSSITLELLFDLMHTVTKTKQNQKKPPTKQKSNISFILNLIAVLEYFKYSLQTLLTVM